MRNLDNRLLRVHANGAEFLARAETFLRRHDSLNALLIALAERTPTGEARFATIEDGDGVRLAAAHTPPRHIALSTCDDDAVADVAVLVDALRARGDVLPGVLGPEKVALAFAARWCERWHVRLHFKVLELTRVIPPKWPEGELRRATEDDVALLSEWSHRFVDETGLPEEDRAAAAPEVVLQRVKNGGLHLWTASGAPVAMAATTPGALGRIGAVYTDPTRRGRGYASAIVARLSEQLLANGSKKVQLSTDAKNPTSNKIYEAIGYAYVGDSVLVSFDVKTP